MWDFNLDQSQLMKWDTVEREFVILANQLHKVATSFEALAGELHRERSSGNRGGSEGNDPAGPKNKGGPAGLPFPGDPLDAIFTRGS